MIQTHEHFVASDDPIKTHKTCAASTFDELAALIDSFVYNHAYQNECLDAKQDDHVKIMHSLQFLGTREEWRDAMDLADPDAAADEEKENEVFLASIPATVVAEFLASLRGDELKFSKSDLRLLAGSLLTLAAAGDWQDALVSAAQKRP